MIKKALIVISSIPAAIGIVISIASKVLLKQIDGTAIEVMLSYGDMLKGMSVETTIVFLATKIEAHSFIIITISAVWLFITAYLWEISKEEVNVK